MPSLLDVLHRVFTHCFRHFFDYWVKSIVCVLVVAGMVPAQAATAVLTDTKPFSVNFPADYGSLAGEDRLYRQAIKEFSLGHHQEAEQLWQTSASQGSPHSQFALGALYSAGDMQAGAQQDYPKALAWYRKAADQGHAGAQFNVGIFYANGQAVTRDMATAATWWRSAATQGHVEAQFNLGLLYAQGEGVTQDLKEAALWWEFAAKQGYAAAQFNLGIMYVKGQGVNEDPTEAVRLWQLSARQGFGQAIHVLKTLEITP